MIICKECGEEFGTNSKCPLCIAYIDEGFYGLGPKTWNWLIKASNEEREKAKEEV